MILFGASKFEEILVKPENAFFVPFPKVAYKEM